jgi:hypothetical protein
MRGETKGRAGRGRVKEEYEGSRTRVDRKGRTEGEQREDRGGQREGRGRTEGGQREDRVVVPPCCWQYRGWTDEGRGRKKGTITGIIISRKVVLDQGGIQSSIFIQQIQYPGRLGPLLVPLETCKERERAWRGGEVRKRGGEEERREEERRGVGREGKWKRRERKKKGEFWRAGEL